jgi:hypothetical protein
MWQIGREVHGQGEPDKLFELWWLVEEDELMKVFISWSGPRSQAVAQTLRTWLKDIMQAVDPWISSADIDKGSRWSSKLARALEDTHIGVICLTPENLTAPWLLFEAGALSKLHTAQNAHVCTYLIGMPYAAVTGPFTEFQHTSATQEDTYLMVQSINAAVEEGKGRLTEDRLKRAFERCWSELQECLDTLPEPQEPIPPPLKVEDMLQNILEIVRDIARNLPLSSQSMLEATRQTMAAYNQIMGPGSFIGQSGIIPVMGRVVFTPPPLMSSTPVPSPNESEEGAPPPK